MGDHVTVRQAQVVSKPKNSQNGVQRRVRMLHASHVLRIYFRYLQ